MASVLVMAPGSGALRDGEAAAQRGTAVSKENEAAAEIGQDMILHEFFGPLGSLLSTVISNAPEAPEPEFGMSDEPSIDPRMNFSPMGFMPGYA